MFEEKGGEIQGVFEIFSKDYQPFTLRYDHYYVQLS